MCGNGVGISTRAATRTAYAGAVGETKKAKARCVTASAEVPKPATASLVFAWPEAPNRNGIKHRLKAILEETKLEHLLPLFADQAVKDDIINYLDDSDLEKLGINKLGDRKRLLMEEWEWVTRNSFNLCILSNLWLTLPPDLG